MARFSRKVLRSFNISRIRSPGRALRQKAGTLERYRLQEWLNFISTEIHKSFSPLLSKSTSEDWRKAATTNISKRFDYVARQLKDGDYLLGEKFSVADAYLFTMLSWASAVGMDLGRWPALKAYQARVTACPSVQEALKAEGLPMKIAA